LVLPVYSGSYTYCPSHSCLLHIKAVVYVLSWTITGRRKKRRRRSARWNPFRATTIWARKCVTENWLRFDFLMFEKKMNAVL